LAERAAGWFDLDVESPYMLLTAQVRRDKQRPVSAEDERRWGIEKLNAVRSEIPAVTHVDCSARVQTVHHDDQPLFHALLTRFGEKTGCPVLVNTSFNVRGEPIVCTPADAYRCFMRTNIDYLVVWPYLLSKTEQPVWREESDWRTEVPLD
jgi:carbamoyltransferase